jgi:hypothetical protein
VAQRAEVAHGQADLGECRLEAVLSNFAGRDQAHRR